MKTSLKLLLALFALIAIADAHAMRWYSSNTGRWFSRDPIGENGGRNLYGFVGNDPIRWVDVLGLAKCEIAILVGHNYQVCEEAAKNYAGACQAAGIYACNAQAWANKCNKDLEEQKKPTVDWINTYWPVGAVNVQSGDLQNGPGLKDHKGIMDQLKADAEAKAEALCKNKCCKDVTIKFLDLKPKLQYGIAGDVVGYTPKEWGAPYAPYKYTCKSQPNGPVKK